ncbi:uncharacterized protein LY79DRAFT_540283 [Colletotrichum navitas]|uniref:Uncharacterized protein n=1 Tax=Colletotrichum navitas TaxID=681940 RepID=A0AAD8Q855_9PEZI|nr:uncharacterized protein LY79DRAFT_540283 [Colletotrichum navitas]KAK1597550.1 hypothetical protein LY79DRAFT_540283 [Colletotrichum navitas]
MAQSFLPLESIGLAIQALHTPLFLSFLSLTLANSPQSVALTIGSSHTFLFLNPYSLIPSPSAVSVATISSRRPPSSAVAVPIFRSPPIPPVLGNALARKKDKEKIEAVSLQTVPSHRINSRRLRSTAFPRFKRIHHGHRSNPGRR